MLYTDNPTHAELVALDAVRGDLCVSLFLPTTPVTRATKADRIAFKNLTTEAIAQLKSAKANKRRISAVESQLDELHDDDRFWAYLADGLAVFVTPRDLKTFRLPLSPAPEVQVSDRFHIKPLVPLVSSAHNCFVLALAQGSIRLIEVTPSLSEALKVPSLPRSLSDAVKRQMPRDRAPAGRIQGSEGMKVLLAQYCRIVDRAIRPILAGQRAPLILATVDELAALYRANSSYAHLAKATIKGNSEHVSEPELAVQARTILKRLERKRVSERLLEINSALNADYASFDLAQISRAAVRGQVASLLVDVTASVPGTIDSSSGKLKMARSASAGTYDVLDELVGLSIRAGGEVLAVDSKALPSDSQVAALMRYRG
ncbi:MAG: hypothetical protein ACR2PG_17280 [Hyphomicrobiaceae bacterium]